MPHLPFFLSLTFSCRSCDAHSTRQFFPMVGSKVRGTAVFFAHWERNLSVTHVKDLSAAQWVAVGHSGCQGRGRLPALRARPGNWRWAPTGMWLPRDHLSVSPQGSVSVLPRLAMCCAVKHAGFAVKHTQLSQFLLCPFLTSCLNLWASIFPHLKNRAFSGWWSGWENIDMVWLRHQCTEGSNTQNPCARLRFVEFQRLYVLSGLLLSFLLYSSCFF